MQLTYQYLELILSIHVSANTLPGSLARNAALARKQAVAFCVFHVGGRYVWRRIMRLMTAQGWADEPQVGL